MAQHESLKSATVSGPDRTERPIERAIHLSSSAVDDADNIFARLNSVLDRLDRGPTPPQIAGGGAVPEPNKKEELPELQQLLLNLDNIENILSQIKAQVSAIEAL